MHKDYLPDYEQMFWRLAIRHIPHHSLLYLAAKQNNKNLVAHLDRRIRKRLDKTSVKSLPSELLADYERKSDNAKFWHGTGRFQYNESEVVDVFQSILDRGTLEPKHDVYSIVISGEEMQSVSATRLRIIARSYADTHGLGIQEKHRYGSSLWWVAYYYNLCYVEILAKHSLAMARNWSTFNRKSRNSQGERTWGKKVHTKAKSVWDTFGTGSDIEGNYPILFGIKKGQAIAELPKSMQKWEVRITTPVTLSSLSHIEVPEAKVAEVKKILSRNGYDVAVFPIEVGEFIASQKNIADLLYKNNSLH